MSLEDSTRGWPDRSQFQTGLDTVPPKLMAILVSARSSNADGLEISECLHAERTVCCKVSIASKPFCCADDQSVKCAQHVCNTAMSHLMYNNNFMTLGLSR
jgi:hypothetical protein